MTAMLRFVTEPRYSGYFFAVAMFVIYGLAPLAVHQWVDGNPYMHKLGLMTCLATVMVVAGFALPVFDRLVGEHRFRIPIPVGPFQIAVWGSFLVFFAVTVATADSVPLLSALSGQFTAEALDLQRGAFLKTREGWEASLGYVSGVYAGLLLPFALSLLFLHRIRGRFVALATFILYTLSFLQNALLIQVVTPLANLSARRLIWNYLGLVALLVASVGLLYLNTTLARGVQEPEAIARILEERARRLEAEFPDGQRPGSGARQWPPSGFFTADYYPASTMEHLVWRTAAVPIFTAADALAVFDKKFHEQPLLGATSSFVAALAGLQRVNYDAEVYGHQWGATEVGRANSFYVTEAYVNFGWAGVAIFSLLVGLAFRVFARSANEAVRSMWPLFAYNIIQASLIGTLLSSGFALVFLIALFCRFTGTAAPQAPASHESYSPDSSP